MSGSEKTRVWPGERISASRRAKRERGIWQRRYGEHQIRDAVDLQRHVDYIPINPVKHGDARRVVDWQYSSFHAYVRLGLLAPDWGGEAASLTGPLGEWRE